MAKDMFPDRRDLLDMIPLPSDVSISKLKDANIMTDTCNTARKHHRLLIEAIMETSKELGIS